MDALSFKKIILYEDNHLLVINKPAGISVQNEAKKGNLFYSAKQYVKYSRNKKGEAWLGMVHRLDQVTSGVLVFACNSKSAGRISSQFRDGIVKKRYLTCVQGYLKEKDKTLENYLKKTDKRSLIVEEGEGRLCSLKYHVVHEWDSMSILYIELITGFYHQIRAQISNLGHPVFGDIKYGGPRYKKGVIFLHCSLVQIVHPVHKEIISFFAPLPASWRLPKKAIDGLEKLC